MSYGAARGWRTHTQTDAGNNNTRRPKLGTLFMLTTKKTTKLRINCWLKSVDSHHKGPATKRPIKENVSMSWRHHAQSMQLRDLMVWRDSHIAAWVGSLIPGGRSRKSPSLISPFGTENFGTRSGYLREGYVITSHSTPWALITYPWSRDV